ncbi:hypothetical protein [Nocardioides abyssi]|uniref:Uncharacterized protein n=1 Tax=Nocardioides abyssi TaxID=3058370 RepID=A0ABT8EY40_9ACTN|nr:hypothetical protein [Nocardioides abyssi]MDN4162939.1 hypothetical protein [Nocardioides abyssi]
MIRKRTFVEGPTFEAGTERIEAVFDTEKNIYNVFHIADNGTSVLIVEDCKTIFEVQDGLDWYCSAHDVDAVGLALEGIKAANTRVASFKAATVDEVEAAARRSLERTNDEEPSSASA